MIGHVLRIFKRLPLRDLGQVSNMEHLQPEPNEYYHRYLETKKNCEMLRNNALDPCINPLTFAWGVGVCKVESSLSLQRGVGLKRLHTHMYSVSLTGFFMNDLLQLITLTIIQLIVQKIISVVLSNPLLYLCYRQISNVLTYIL